MALTDAELKNLIARMALSGVSQGTALENAGFKIEACDIAPSGGRNLLGKTVQISIVDPKGWPRVFELTVRELL